VTNNFLIQSHRGAGEENTLASFETAWELGCVPEADLRTTVDGVIVAFHDAEIGHRKVSQITLDELRRLSANVPRIDEVFEKMRGHPDQQLYLDIKTVMLEQLAASVRDHHLERQIIFTSTHYELIRDWRHLMPQSQTLLWIGGSEEALVQRFEALHETDFADITQLQIHVHLKTPAAEIRRESVDPFAESDAFISKCSEEVRKRGVLFQALPYGGSTPAIYLKLLDLGVMSFATDYTSIALAAVREFYHA
jgi:glycerophosphoryl diester phosphodiesterase